MNVDVKKLEKRLGRAKEANKLDDWETCCRRLAEIHATCGRYEQALSFYEEELSVAEMRGDAKAVAGAHRMVGEMQSTLGQFESSLRHVNHYLDYAQKSRNSVEQQRALATIGRTYFCWAAELQASEIKQDNARALKVLKDCRKAYMKSMYICDHELSNLDERHEMKARILYNLGLACEIENDLPTALEYVDKSINICKKQNLFEDLHRCYISKGSMLLRKGEHAAGLTAIEHAVQVANKLSNEAAVLALYHKSEIFFAMGSYVSAKTVLKKAYKLKSPNDEDRNSVEKALKLAILLCDLEAKLSSESDVKERKILYEKLGDACCSVKNFKHAIKSYENMSECVLLLGLNKKELQACYVSLYQTYKDDKNYGLALEFARKEFDMCKNSPVDAAKSHLVIGELLELRDRSYDEVTEQYMSAKRIAEDIKDNQLLASALRRLMVCQKNNGYDKLSEDTRKELDSLNLSDDESQSESEASATEYIHLSDLSDSDQERKSKKFKITKNEKGETGLHLAAIKGDLSRVEKLISMGHPVKERDLAGWTPLHEAANHGYTDIVKILLRAGADVNDPGGKDCGGVTPLHDAASCGHFDVVLTLLAHNASVTVLTDTGDTPLDCLKDWRSRVDNLSGEDSEVYETIVSELERKLAEAGVPPKEKRQEKGKERLLALKPVKSARKAPEERSAQKEQRRIERDRSSREENSLRRNSEIDLRRSIDDEGSSRRNVESGSYSWQALSQETIVPLVLNSSPESSPRRRKSPTRERPVADYRAAIEGLRKRPQPIAHPKPQQAALVDANSYVDEWLEDDLRQNRAQKKRKISDFIERTPRRQSNETRPNNELSDIFYPLDNPMDYRGENPAKKRPKVQTSMTDYRIPTPMSELGNTLFQPPPSPTYASSPIRPPFGSPPNTYDLHDLPPSPPISSVSDHQSLTKVRVNVASIILLIPVDSSKVKELTVKWLAEEASRRYSELEGVEPLLQLKTRDGARIASTDPVSVTLGEELDSTIVGWRTVSLVDRYREAVAQEQLLNSSVPSSYGGYLRPPDSAVIERLAACDVSKWLDLQYMALSGGEIRPVLKALRHERRLNTFNICGNMLGDHELDTLMGCMKNCSLEELNLRCNNITNSGMTKLLSLLPSMSDEFRTSLRCIDLGFNPIGEINEETRQKLENLLPNLTQLKTDECATIL